MSARQTFAISYQQPMRSPSVPRSGHAGSRLRCRRVNVDRHYMVERVRLSNIEVAIFIVVVAVAVALLLANR